MCDNSLILLITAFEAYLVNNYNKIRITRGDTEIDPRLLKFQSKDDLKGRGIMSPNLADAFIMSFIISLINNSQVSDLEITGF